MIKRRSHAVACAVLLALSGLAQAQGQLAPSQPVAFKITAPLLSDALIQFTEQSGLQFVLPLDGRMLRAKPVVGNLTPAAALDQLLQGSGLRYEFTNARTVSIWSEQGGENDQSSFSMSPTAAVQYAPMSQSAASEPPADVEMRNFKGIPEVLVEGQRTRNMDVTRTEDDPQPYYIFQSEDINKSGATNVQHFLQQRLTMDTTVGASGNYGSNFTGNASSFNLRGLGSNATLILIDGRRTVGLPASGGNVFQADVNGIPLAAIEKIEVLPSSAAAIYGGAALGGVINIVLKHDYSGADLALRYESPMDVSAGTTAAEGAWGLTFEEGRTNVLFGAHFTESDSLTWGDRPELIERGIRRMLENDPLALASGRVPFPVGSTPNIASANGSPLVLRPEYGGTALGSSYTHVPAGTSPATSAAQLGAGLAANAGRYNFDLSNGNNSHNSGGPGLRADAVPAIKQHSFFVSLRRQMTDSLEVFADFFDSRNTAESVFNPFSYPVSRTVSAASPANPFMQDVIVTFPSNYAGTYEAESKSRRADVGLIAKLPGKWMVEADYTWNRSSHRYDRPAGAFAPLNTAFGNGTFDPFVDTLQYPLDLSQYSGSSSYYAPSNELNDVNLRIAGPVFDMPGGTPFLTVGIGHREESLDQSTFVFEWPNFPATNLGFLNLSQRQATDSLYAEMTLPLVSSLNARPGVQQLDLQLAARTERYSVKSRPTTVNYFNPGTIPPYSEKDYSSTHPTIAINYRPVRSVALRTSYGTAFLPPSYAQLLPGVPQTFGVTVIDPRRGNTLQFVPNVIVGGNPDIEPQNSTAWNAGIIWEPHFVNGLRLNLEWFRIVQDDVIVAPSNTQSGQQQVIDNENVLPDYVVRGPVQPGDPYGVGPIQTMYIVPVNGAQGTTEGFDLSIDYRLTTSGGNAWRFSALGTYVDRYEIQYVNAPVRDLVNEVSNNGPLRLRANASVQWESSEWTLGWRVNYLNSYQQSATFVAAQGSEQIPSYTWHTAFAEYRVPALDGLLENLTLQAGVKNVFNKVPPFDAGIAPERYRLGDPRLRSFWLSLGKRF